MVEQLALNFDSPTTVVAIGAPPPRASAALSPPLPLNAHVDRPAVRLSAPPAKSPSSADRTSQGAPPATKATAKPKAAKRARKTPARRMSRKGDDPLSEVGQIIKGCHIPYDRLGNVVFQLLESEERWANSVTLDQALKGQLPAS